MSTCEMLSAFLLAIGMLCNFKNKIKLNQKNQKVYIGQEQDLNWVPHSWQANTLTTAPAQCILATSCI